MVLLLVGRGEEAVDLRSLHSTGGRVDKVDKEEVEEEAEEEAEEKVEEEVEEETLLPCWAVKCNILYILYRGIGLHA